MFLGDRNLRRVLLATRLGPRDAHAARRTVEHLQRVELLLALEAVHEEGDVVAGLHAEGPGAGLRVEVVAGITWAEDDPRGLGADLVGRALCWGGTDGRSAGQVLPACAGPARERRAHCPLTLGRRGPGRGQR